MKNKLLLILIVFLSISLVSAQGLIVNPTSFNINKTQGEIVTITFNITNNLGYDIFDIQPKDSNTLEFEKFNLKNGLVAIVNATVKTEQSKNTEILWFYNVSDLGTITPSERLLNIHADYPNYVDNCTITINKGDTVSWTNQMSASSVELLDGVSLIIPAGETKSLTFNEEVSTNYKIKIGQFSKKCFINIRPSGGLASDPEKNIILNLNIQVQYLPTELEVQVFETDYIISAGSSSIPRTLFIKNTGGNIAKNINLEGSWFVFSDNNFDIEAGKSKEVSFSIKPDIKNTNETNKTYQKNLTISGNFETIYKTFNIEIPYKVITDTGTGETPMSELVKIYYQILRSFCAEDINENMEVCLQLKNIEIETFGEDGEMSSLEAQIDSLIRAFILDADDRARERNIEQQIRDQLNSTLGSIQSEQQSTKQETSELRNLISSLTNSVTGVTIIVMGTVIIVILVFLIIHFRKKRIKDATDYLRKSSLEGEND